MDEHNSVHITLTLQAVTAAHRGAQLLSLPSLLRPQGRQTTTRTSLKKSKNGVRSPIAPEHAHTRTLGVTFIHHPAYFGIEDCFGFNAWYGFGATVALVAVAKVLSIFIRRKDTYYDRD